MNILQAINESWGWTGIEPEEVVGENDFGNLIIKDVRGRYWRLCPEDVYCKIIAESRVELDSLLLDQEFLADWYMTKLVEQARNKLGPLGASRKYHFAIPGILGGAYGSENFQTVSQAEQIRFSGDIGMQIEELPDGAQIELKVIS